MTSRYYCRKKLIFRELRTESIRRSQTLTKHESVVIYSKYT